MRPNPSGVRGPVDKPPCHLHLWVRLTFKLGRPHCSFVRDDRAWQRWHLILPPAVIKYFSGLYKF